MAIAFNLPDAVKQQSTTQGNTGAIDFSASVDGFEDFGDSPLAQDEETIVVRRDGTDWEVMYVTFDKTSDELDVVSVGASSNGDSRKDWGVGTRDVFIAPAGFAMLLRNSNDNALDGQGRSLGYEPAIDDGTKSSGTFTPNPSDGQIRTATNGGAFTLAPTSEEGMLQLTITNNASAGAITTSGFDDVAGDSLDTTDGNVFVCLISNDGVESRLDITASGNNS